MTGGCWTVGITTREEEEEEEYRRTTLVGIRKGGEVGKFWRGFSSVGRMTFSKVHPCTCCLQ